jgi:adenylate cyclase class 2
MECLSKENLEVEIKVKVNCDELSKIEKELIEKGAKFLDSREEKDLYLNHPCKDLKLKDEALRIRYVNGHPETITYKGNRSKEEELVKSREELKVKVDNDPIALFEKLGFSPGIYVTKFRKYYSFKEVLVTLDKVDSLGCFIEIESNRKSVDDIKETINELNINGDIVKKTYAELIEELNIS